MNVGKGLWGNAERGSGRLGENGQCGQCVVELSKNQFNYE